MSFRTIVLIAVSAVIGIAAIAIASTDTFARDAQMNNLSHKRTHHHAVNHGRSAHPGSSGQAAKEMR